MSPQASEKHQFSQPSHQSRKENAFLPMAKVEDSARKAAWHIVSSWTPYLASGLLIFPTRAGEKRDLGNNGMMREPLERGPELPHLEFLAPKS